MKMTKHLTTKPETQTSLILNNEAEDANILNAAKEDGGFEKILKFKQGDYFINETLVPLGSEFLAHATSWTKTWIKFVDDQVADRKLYVVARGEKPAQREELDDYEESAWPKRDGKPNDPWVFQYLLPLENMASGEIVIFVTRSVGGRKAVADLCGAYVKRKLAQKKMNQPGGQPIVRLACVDMPTKHGKPVPRPEFTIVGWDDTAANHEGVAETSLAEITPTNDDIDDEIPF
jgi:hypothetical protein